MALLRNTIYAIALTLTLHSCDRTPSILETAEQQMEFAPDSALVLLETISIENFYRKSDKALYALLYCMALDKNDIKIDSDSLITIATKYYNSKDPLRATYAWYYMSRYQFHFSDKDAQAKALLQANEFAQGVKDQNIKALIYTSKAELHNTQFQEDSALFYYKKAIDNFLELDDLRNGTICYIHYGSILTKKKKYKDAIIAYNNAKKMAVEIEDSILISTIYRSIASIYRNQGKLEDAKRYLLIAPKVKSEIYNYNTNYLLAKILLQQNKIDSSFIFLNKVDTSAFYYPDVFELWKDYYYKKQDFANALKYSEKILICTDSLNRKALKESFSGMEKKFNYQELKLANSFLQLENSQKSTLMLGILLLVSGGIIGFLYWRNLLVHKQITIEKELSKQQSLKAEKEHENSILLEKQLKLQKIVVANLEQYRKNAIKQPDKIKTGFSPIENSDFFEELKTAIDLEFNNITIRLNEKYNNLSQSDIIICCLILAYFDTGMISSILGIKQASMNIRRSRLRSKLKIDNSVKLIEFLEQF